MDCGYIWYHLCDLYISMIFNISRCKSVMSCHVRPSIAHPIASWSLPDTKCPVISGCDKLKELLYLASFLHFWCFCLVPFFSSDVILLGPEPSHSQSHAVLQGKLSSMETLQQRPGAVHVSLMFLLGHLGTTQWIDAMAKGVDYIG